MADQKPGGFNWASILLALLTLGLLSFAVVPFKEAPNPNAKHGSEAHSEEHNTKTEGEHVQKSDDHASPDAHATTTEKPSGELELALENGEVKMTGVLAEGIEIAKVSDAIVSGSPEWKVNSAMVTSSTEKHTRWMDHVGDLAALLKEKATKIEIKEGWVRVFGTYEESELDALKEKLKGFCGEGYEYDLSGAFIKPADVTPTEPAPVTEGL